MPFLIWLTLKLIESLQPPQCSFKMNLQRTLLSHKQLAEVFFKPDNTRLLTDEKCKFNKKFMGYEATDSEDNFWVLGLASKVC